MQLEMAVGAARAAVADVLIRILTLRYCAMHAEKCCVRSTLNHDAISFTLISYIYVFYLRTGRPNITAEPIYGCQPRAKKPVSPGRGVIGK